MRHDHRSPVVEVGFTLIEILLVVGIIILLAGVLLGGIAVVSKRVKASATYNQVAAVASAMRIYRQEDKLGRFPLANTGRSMVSAAFGGGPPGVADLLAEVGLSLHGENLLTLTDGSKVLADAWKQQVMYQLDDDRDGLADRPLDAAGIAVSSPGDCDNWNPRGEEPYPYVWSWNDPGTPRDHANAKRWIYLKETPE